MPARPTPLSALTAWRFDPAGVLLVLVLGAGYFLLVRRVDSARRADSSGERWSSGRSWFFVAGLAGIAYLTCGFVGVYARVLLWSFALQVVLLLVVVPALLAFGRPLSLIRLALPGRPAAVVAGALRSPAGRVVASPATGPLVIPVVLAVVFFSGLLPTLLLHAWASDLLVVVLLAVGFLIALPLGGDDEDATALAIAAGIFLGLIGLLADAVPGIVLRLTTHPLAPAAVAMRHAAWAPSPLQDQQFAGAILWFLGEVLDLPFLGLLLVRWIRADAREARRVDAELDAATLVTPLDRDPEVPPGTERPWWETDPDRLGARRARAIREAADRPGSGRP